MTPSNRYNAPCPYTYKCGSNIQSRQGKRRICWNASAALLAVSATPSASSFGCAARLAVTDRPPSGLFGFRCPAGKPGPANLIIGSVRLPSRLLRLGCLAGWLGSTNLLVGSVRLPDWLARLRSRAAWHVSVDPLDGSVRLPGWLTRHGNPDGLTVCPAYL
jgi:hypothetical protein